MDERGFSATPPLARVLLLSGPKPGAIVIRQLVREEEGQSTVEYMLLISVIVIAMVAAAYAFVPTFQEGVRDLAQDVKRILSTGKIGGVGTSR